MALRALLAKSGGTGNASYDLSTGGQISLVLPMEDQSYKVSVQPAITGVTITKVSRDIAVELNQPQTTLTGYLSYNNSTGAFTVRVAGDSVSGVGHATAWNSAAGGPLIVGTVPYNEILPPYNSHCAYVFELEIDRALLPSSVQTDIPFTFGHLPARELEDVCGRWVSAQVPIRGGSGVGFQHAQVPGIYFAAAFGLFQTSRNTEVSPNSPYALSAVVSYGNGPPPTTISVSSAKDYAGVVLPTITLTLSGTGYYFFVWASALLVLYVDVTKLSSHRMNIYNTNALPRSLLYVDNNDSFFPPVTTDYYAGVVGQSSPRGYYMVNLTPSSFTPRIRVTDGFVGGSTYFAVARDTNGPGDGVGSGVLSTVAGNYSTDLVGPMQVSGSVQGYWFNVLGVTNFGGSVPQEYLARVGVNY